MQLPMYFTFIFQGVNEEADFEFVAIVDEPGEVEDTVVCHLKHSSAPVHLYVKASFKVRVRHHVRHAQRRCRGLVK